MTDTYHKVADDEIVVVDLDEPFLKVACCDCGLVHTWAFGLRHRDGRMYLEISIDRLKGCTAQKRRHGNVDLMGKDDQWILKRRKK